jgi:AcrR family transcriptional regulator
MARRRRLSREESKARTRTELLRAANRLFLRDGFVDTSLANIAEEAALTKGAVYSNFESKEDLFLALLQEGSDREWSAPSHLAQVEGDDERARAAAFGRYSAGQRPTRRHVAMFLEMNAAALRSDRAREWVVGNNQQFFERLGEGLRDLLDAPDADAARLGLLAQSLYVGLVMHGAFSDDVDEDTFAWAYELLAHVARGAATADRA